MFDLFGIKKRKLEAFQELDKERISIISNRQHIVSQYLDKKSIEYHKRQDELIQTENERVERVNSTCPICGGHRIIHKFVRGNGSLSGNLSGHGGWTRSQIRGHVQGSYDTLRVNECKDCGEQWEIETNKFVPEEYPFTVSWCSHIGRLIRYTLMSILNGTKLKLYRHLAEPFVATPRPVLEYLFYSCISKEQILARPSNECFVNLGEKINSNKFSKDFNNDPYLWKMKDEVWESIRVAINEVCAKDVS